MSHLTTYHSDVLINCKKTLLNRAVADLGLKIDWDIRNIKNTWITDTVDCGFVKNGTPISVGLKFNKEGANTKLEVAGDFWGTGIDQLTFIDKLAQSYKKHDVIFQCEQQGWTVNKEDVFIDKKTNEVVIQANRYIV